MSHGTFVAISLCLTLSTGTLLSSSACSSGGKKSPATAAAIDSDEMSATETTATAEESETPDGVAEDTAAEDTAAVDTAAVDTAAVEKAGEERTPEPEPEPSVEAPTDASPVAETGSPAPEPVVEEPLEAEPVEPPSRYDPDDHTIVVIEAGALDDGGQDSLWQVAQKERERRESGEKPVIVLTDKNLAEMAAGGEITEATPTEAPPTEPPQVDAGSTGSEAVDGDELGRDETYWRRGVLELRLAWREATDSIERLEEEAFKLRMRFYAEDDPFYRDGQIKPTWDHTLQKLSEARTQIVLKQRELERFLEEGRRAGALPGWLREGIDLEPEVEIVEEGSILQPGEPVVAPEAGATDG